MYEPLSHWKWVDIYGLTDVEWFPLSRQTRLVGVQFTSSIPGVSEAEVSKLTYLTVFAGLVEQKGCHVRRMLVLSYHVVLPSCIITRLTQESWKVQALWVTRSTVLSIPTSCLWSYDMIEVSRLYMKYPNLLFIN